jgi:hypothetical protein
MLLFDGMGKESHHEEHEGAQRKEQKLLLMNLGAFNLSAQGCLFATQGM